MLAVSLSGCDPREWFVCSLGLCGYALDDVAPATPRDLKAAAGDRAVTLSWTASGDLDVDHYEIYRAPAPVGPYLPWGSSFTNGYQDSGVTNGTAYSYVVSAKDKAGNESAHSSPVSATPQPPLPHALLPPPVLTGAGEFGDVHLTWTEVSGAKEYLVLRATRPGGPYTQIDQTIVRFHTDRDALAGTGYYYVVATVNDEGRPGAYSNEVFATPYANSGPDLGLLKTWSGFTSPAGIAASPAGDVYVTDKPGPLSRVQRFTTNGDFVSSWTLSGTARGIAVGRLGNVYVVAGNTVRHYTAGGATLDPFGSLNEANGIATDATGNVYIADTGNGRIVKYSSDGELLTSWPAAAYAIATDAAGGVYALDRAGNRVVKFSASGTQVVEWGEHGSGDSQFDAPEGIAVDNTGRVFVADTGNDRIEIFTTGGALSAVFGGTSQFEGPTALAADCHPNLYVLDAGNARAKKLGPSVPTSCTASAAVRRGFEATMTTTASAPGALRGTRELGAAARGTFRAKASRTIPRSFARGTWRARFDATGAGAKGVALVTARGGRLCLGFDLKLAGTRVSGTFKTLGGSGAARSLHAGGTFTETLGATRTFTLKGSGDGRRGRSRGLTAACKQLR